MYGFISLIVTNINCFSVLRLDKMNKCDVVNVFRVVCRREKVGFGLIARK